MKLKNIINAAPSFQKLASATLSRKTLYWVNKLMTKIENEINFYNTERQKIIDKYGIKVDSERFKIKDEYRAAYEKEMNELFDIDVECEIKPISLPTEEDIQLSYNDLKALEGFVDVIFDESEEDKK